MKTYIKPIAEIVEIEAESLICQSPTTITEGTPLENVLGESNVRSNWLDREDFSDMW